MQRRDLEKMSLAPNDGSRIFVAGYATDADCRLVTTIAWRNGTGGMFQNGGTSIP